MSKVAGTVFRPVCITKKKTKIWREMFNWICRLETFPFKYRKILASLKMKWNEQTLRCLLLPISSALYPAISDAMQFYESFLVTIKRMNKIHSVSTLRFNFITSTTRYYRVLRSSREKISFHLICMSKE